MTITDFIWKQVSEIYFPREVASIKTTNYLVFKKQIVIYDDSYDKMFWIKNVDNLV